MRRYAIAAAVAAALTTPAHADTAVATAKAITLAPLSIVKYGDLDFGTIVATGAAGTVDVDAATDARSTSGGATAAGGAPTAARFYTYGTGLQTLEVTLGAPPTLTHATSAATMNVTALTLDQPTITFLSAAGLVDLHVGGTLAVGANQPDGLYSGTFDVTVTYY
jgi:Domain of unknown function (DUF4402)